MAWSLRAAKTLKKRSLFVLAVFGSSLFVAPLTAKAASLGAYLENRAGIRQFKDKQYYPAFQDFLKALNAEPLNPDLQMNLGMTFVANEDWDKAEAAFQSAYDLAKGDGPREFFALFNLAFAHWQKGDIESALKSYQMALEIEPESLEVKTDIELMWQSQQGKSDNKSGKGDGQGDDKKDNKDQKDQDKDKDKNKNQDKQYSNEKPKPKPFNSKDLSKEAVRKILDEISNQEQSIRAKEYDKGAKERSNDKDW